MARLGRGQRVQPRFAARIPTPAPPSATGAVAGSGGGSVPANLVLDPDLGSTQGWATSGFSLTASGATLNSGALIFGAVGSGANYAPRSLGQFQAGVRYVARLRLAAGFPSLVVEVILGSTADSFTSKTVAVSTSGTVVDIAWTPSVAYSAFDHGLAIRLVSGSTPLASVSRVMLAPEATFKNAVMAPTGSGGGGATLAARKGATTTVSLAGGGTGTVTATSSNLGLVDGTGGGSATLTGRKSVARSSTGTGGGTGAISAVKTPELGGVLWTGLFGGGGRVGRSHPAGGTVSRGNVPMNAANPEARAGSVVGTGGGGNTTTTTVTAAKGGRAVTVEFTGVPPVFVDQRAGVISHGGGALRYTYSRSAAGVGIVTGSGGGGATLTGRRGASQAATGTGGGSATLRTPKGGRGAVTGTGGGGGTFSYALAEFRSGTAQGTGGGSATTARIKNARGVCVGSGGGGATLRLSRATGGTVTGTGGGTATLTVQAAGPIAVGALTSSGGGGARLAGARGAAAVITASGGGTAIIRGGRGITGTVAGSGGGNGVITVIVLGTSLYFSDGAPAGRILVGAPSGTITP